jgi:pyruvate dehydrogenase E1 component alpha subunit
MKLRKAKMFQVLGVNGKTKSDVVIPDETLIRMYEAMKLTRISDIKALQFQRQGRMLTYAPSQGQEAAQVGSMSATEDNDWMAQAFREMGALLYKGASLKQIFLYWYGNEDGSKYEQNILPVSVPIASQLNHATGVAYASKILNKNQVVMAYVGDGGTSHGEFHEAMNFAQVFNLPMVTIIQNNHYAISTPRDHQTKSETLAQKAIAYGMTGVQVDGNDVLAMYQASKEAVDRARNGEGPTLIEAVTYRLGSHTTADDPTIYRDNEEVEEWKKKDPILRFEKYMIEKGLLSKESIQEYEEKYSKYVTEEFKKVEATEYVMEDIFKYNYESMTPQLEEQLKEYKMYLESEGL